MNFLEFSEDIGLFAELLRQSLREEPSAASAVQAEPRGPVRAGQVWTTRTGARKGLPCMVLLLRKDDALWEGVLLTDQLWMATAQDLILPEDAGTLGQAVAACLDRVVEIAPTSLALLSGELRPPFPEVVRRLMARGPGHLRQLLGPVGREQLPGCESAERSLLKWEVRAPGSSPLRYVSGTELQGEDDPREALRDLLGEATRYLGEEASAWSMQAAGLAQPVVVAGAGAAAIPPVFSPWSLLLPSMRRAFREIGTTLLFPEEALVPARSEQEAGEVRAEATLALGDIAVDLDLRLANERLILQGTASRGDAPVAGVSLELIQTIPGEEPFRVRRETSEDGVFFAVRLPTPQGATHELTLSHGEVQVKLRW